MALSNFQNGDVLTETELNAIVTEVNGKASKAVATTSANGLMSKEDKTKLDGVAEGANKYVHPTTSGNKHIPSGGSAGKVLKWTADGTVDWADDLDHTYKQATESAIGLVKQATTQADSVATDVAGLVADFNALLKKLKDAGIMA